MTDNNKIQANSVDNNKIQASLTEQLYAGTLPTGHYYLNNGVETYIILYSNANTKDRKMQEPSGWLTVISEVPSYEEWKAKLEENTKLKKLLKECRGEISPYKDFISGISGKKTFKSLIAKINQALGED